MAILRDANNDGTYVEFSFVKCIPGKLEGCQLNFKYYKSHEKVYDLDFGWTNLTIENYIEVMTGFPLETLNHFILNNLYTSIHLLKIIFINLSGRNEERGIYIN